MIAIPIPESSYWESWHPRIGDRVRVTLSECRCWEHRSQIMRRVVGQGTLIGTVASRDTSCDTYPDTNPAEGLTPDEDPCAAMRGHYYEVVFDAPVENDFWSALASAWNQRSEKRYEEYDYFAAGELTLVERGVT